MFWCGHPSNAGAPRQEPRKLLAGGGAYLAPGTLPRVRLCALPSQPSAMAFRPTPAERAAPYSRGPPRMSAFWRNMSALPPIADIPVPRLDFRL